jgi:hypothetical protein
MCSKDSSSESDTTVARLRFTTCSAMPSISARGSAQNMNGLSKPRSGLYRCVYRLPPHEVSTGQRRQVSLGLPGRWSRTRTSF